MVLKLIGRLLRVALLLFVALPAYADDPFAGSRSNIGGGSNSMGRTTPHNFNSHRSELNGQYIKLTREAWKQLRNEEAVPQPKDENPPIPPVVINNEDTPVQPEDREVTIEKVITPAPPHSRPQPVIIPQENNSANTNYHEFTYFGTSDKVRIPEKYVFTLKGTTENNVADAWEILSNGSFDNTVADCLEIRSRRKLDDWAYLQMLNALGKSVYGRDSDRAAIFTTYIFSQSGYRARMARSNSGRLSMLYASDYLIYDKGYFILDSERFYPLENNAGESLYVCGAAYPGEKPLSLAFRNAPGFDYVPSPQRTLQSRRYPDINVEITTNSNVMPFFENYPTSMVGNDMMSRWALYANTPLQEPTRRQLYGTLNTHLNAADKLQSAQKLLDWVQTAFEYGYDDQIWGGDRAFFADETLYYPFCDCEDRSILFSRLVRDLLHLPVVLVYYPGHLATAVAFDVPVSGDYIILNGRKYTVCDPTYVGASVGMTMPGMDNSKAQVILLKN